MAINTMQDLFVHGLRDIFYAEKQLTKALPKMARAVQSEELREAIRQHLEETKGQVERLTQVFESIDVSARGVRCEAIEGLVAEAQEVMEEVEDPEVRDAGIIVAAQKVEHYEIAAYGSLRAMATQLGHAEAARLLEETLGEERHADEKLSQLALGGVNASAGNGDKPAAKSRARAKA